MSNIKEHPILFSDPLVRAILEGQKTVTRRAVKTSIPNSALRVTAYRNRLGSQVFGAVIGQSEKLGEITELTGIKCPYGQPGERLWVREAWATDAQVNAVAPRDLSQGEPIQYRADGAVRQTGCSMITLGKTRPSIYLPRWASRIALEITDVRIERLQDISEEQARAEGASFHEGHGIGHSGWRHDQGDVFSSARNSFAHLWASINGRDSWNTNPWVWCVSFKRAFP